MLAFQQYLSVYEQTEVDGVRLYLRREDAGMLLESGIGRPWELVPDNALARGKGMALELGGRKMFIKRYFRGGIFAFFLGDRYLFLKRFEKELAAYEALKSSPVQVPTVFSLVIEKRGLFFRAWLLTEFIENCIGLESFLEKVKTRKRRNVLIDLGNALHCLHEKDIVHPDLTLNNICIDSEERIVLLDFDRCTFSASCYRKWFNLFRLHRSCMKTGIWKKAGCEQLDKKSLQEKTGKSEKNDMAAFLSGYLENMQNKPGLVRSWFSGYRFWEKAHSLFWK